MIAWIERAVEKSLKKRIDARGLAIFRVLYTAILLGEVVQLFRFRHLIYDKLPFLQVSESDPTVPLLVWIVVLLFLLLGYYTRLATIVNYLFSLVYFSTTHAYEYHMFHVYMVVNFLMMFAPVSATGSFDRVRYRLRLPRPQADRRAPPTVSVLHYRILVLAGLAFVYFDSVFYKIMANLWQQGLGVWLPSSLPPVVIGEYTTLLNQKALMLFLGYLTLVFEALFIFLFWLRPFRVPLVVIGVGLHMGILFVYPIPWFALGFVSLYALLIPVGWWRALAGRIRLKRPRRVRYYDPGVPLSDAVRIVCQSLDVLGWGEWECIVTDGAADKRLPAVYHFLRWLGVDSSEGNQIPVPAAPVYSRFRIRMVTLGIVLLCTLQAISLYNAPLVKWLTQNLRIAQTYPGVVAAHVSKSVQKQTKIFLGITGHTVFLDQHFEGYNHIIAVQYMGKDTVFLPIIDEHGKPGAYLVGPTWARWSFRVNGPTVDLAKVTSGVRDFTAFWLKEHNMKFSDQHFRIVVKKMDTPTVWEPDFLARQLLHPWQVAGTAEWNNGVFEADIDDIESL